VFCFIDLNGYQVNLSFKRDALMVEPRHVLVLLKHEGKWLCTIHKQRGVEFPGGKAEIGETLEQAAIREVYEETGVIVKDLEWFAEYVVHDDMTFCKAVFLATFSRQDVIPFDLETSGMLWLTEEEWLACPELSFHMRDGCMHRILEEVKSRGDKR